ncbi:hypothetical protein SAY86_001452 [Trapa natans]|uniref:WRKY domain-containing protein n=1 Tax=Trapa natans TaxID=22666 RepID=A0AAN7MDI7_TRANT|nr:hypothetical protein SAY86_001452 [Trapa natans]
MDHGKVPLPPLTLDLDGNSCSINPSAVHPSSNIPPLLLPPNILQECLQLSNMDMEWANFLFGPMKIGNGNYPQRPSSPPTGMGGDVIGGDGSSGATMARAPDDTRKITGRTKRSVPPRVAFHTRSPDDVLDDGYRWRKYGQKAVKNSSHPRSYYRCTHHTCNVKKQIQRHANDPEIVITTYEGKHDHPSEKLMETLAPLLKQLQFLTRL